jgi:hypothetical protein
LLDIVTLWELCNGLSLGEELVRQMMHFIMYIIWMSTSKVWSWRKNTQITLIQWNDTKKCWVYARYAYQTLHKVNYSLACTSYDLSISSFHTLHVWYIVSYLLWFSYDPWVICFIPNACFKFRKWHMTCVHRKNLERKSTPRSKRDQRSHKRYFILILHVFFPQNNSFIRINFERFFLQLVMRNDSNFPNKSSKKFNHFLINMNLYKCIESL